MPRGTWKALFATIVLTALPGWAGAQIDPEERTTLLGGAESPLSGNGPLLGYGFLLLNRPHIGGPDNYLRIAAAPPYAYLEWIHDNWPFRGGAIGIGGNGGLFSNNFYDYKNGRYLPGESFRGHSLGMTLSYYLHPYKIMGRIPVNVEFRVGPTYLMYRDSAKTDPEFAVPQDGPVYMYRFGLRIGGVPPILAASQGLQFNVFYETDHRSHAGRYGLPGDAVATRSWTSRAWLQTGGIIPLPHGQVVSLFYSIGATGQADPLDVFRMGGSLRFRDRFPLILHGYYQNEVFATRYRLVNASYRFPLVPGQRRAMLRLNFDYAKVSYLEGYALPNRDLIGTGADIILDWSHSLRLVTGYSYGPSISHGDRSYSSRVNFQVQIKM